METDQAARPPKFNPKQIVPDLIAGLTTAIADIPDAMALAVLAGANPVYGLYAIMVGKPIGGLLTSSHFMTLAVTSAMALTAGMAGMLLGGVYGHYVSSSRVFRADAKTLVGLLAGSAASLLLLAIALVAGSLPLWLITAILCPATGLVYILVAPWFVQHFHNLLPPVADGAMGVSWTWSAGRTFSPLYGRITTPCLACSETVISYACSPSGTWS